jgi:molybdopterin-guanine dinucleotide biosynthesis protein A
VNIRYLDGDEIHPYDPDRLAFFNINTPEDLKEAENLALTE